MVASVSSKFAATLPLETAASIVAIGWQRRWVMMWSVVRNARQRDASRNWVVDGGHDFPEMERDWGKRNEMATK